MRTGATLHLSFGTQLLETRSRLSRIYGSADTDCSRQALVIDAIAISHIDNISYLTSGGGFWDVNITSGG